MSAPPWDFVDGVLCKRCQRAEPRGHAAQALAFERQSLKQAALQDGGHGVASRRGRISDDPLRPRWLKAHTGCRDNKGDDDAATNSS